METGLKDLLQVPAFLNFFHTLAAGSESSRAQANYC